VATSCVPGFELLPSQGCNPCPLNFYCVGGVTGSSACPSATFSFPGANSSASCLPAVFVEVVVSLPLAANNFTMAVRDKFRTGLAMAANVDSGRVSIAGVVESVRRSTSLSMQVTSNIAADNAQAAESISSGIKPSDLNSMLSAEGLPSATLQAVTVKVSSAQSASAFSLPAVVVGSVGGFAVLAILLGAGHYLVSAWQNQRAHRAFIKSFHSSNCGDRAGRSHLPPELARNYVAHVVLGKGHSDAS